MLNINIVYCANNSAQLNGNKLSKEEVLKKVCTKGATTCGLLLLHTLNPYVFATMGTLMAVNTAVDVWKNYDNKDTWKQFGLKAGKTPLLMLTKMYGPTIAGQIIGAYTGFSSLGLIGEGLTALWATSDVTQPVVTKVANVVEGKLKEKIDEYNQNKSKIEINDEEDCEVMDGSKIIDYKDYVNQQNNIIQKNLQINNSNLLIKQSNFNQSNFNQK